MIENKSSKKAKTTIIDFEIHFEINSQPKLLAQQNDSWSFG
jgi:hypothetical protein